MFVRAVIVVMVVIVAAVVLFLQGTAVASDETDAENAGHDRGDEADDGPDDRRHPSEEGVGNENRIRSRFGSGDQEGHAGRAGGTLPPHLGDHRHHRATAKRHGHADGRADADRLQTVVTKPPENRLAGYEYVKQSREEQPEQEHGRQQKQRHPQEVEEIDQQAPQLNRHSELPVLIRRHRHSRETRAIANSWKKRTANIDIRKLISKNYVKFSSSFCWKTTLRSFFCFDKHIHRFEENVSTVQQQYKVGGIA